MTFNYKAKRIGGRKGRCIPEHLYIAETVFGGRLPKGTEVHHLDENIYNNNHNNLVICQDKSYHKLLHARKRILDNGGNPNTQKICTTCQTLKNRTEYYKYTLSYDKLTPFCKSCGRIQSKKYYYFHKEIIESMKSEEQVKVQ